ncbi:MAG: ABC transporter ATP-binding protein [Betaproteobacteria bacterium]|nr:ABC transporter ATP-binding protein [Betaproteobacteria bacterium]
MNDRLAMPPRLQLRGITKRYPAVVANDGVDLAVRPGEIHAVLGENGAGKSTLMKIIYGVTHPDSGEMLWEGRPVQIASPAEARRLGVGMVFQHFALFETLTVAENISLALDERIQPAKLAPRIREVSQNYGLPIDPDRLVHSMSVGERQRVEIVRCLLQNPKLLIMDEPTSVLTPQAVLKLFETLRRLAAEGCSILYISHKLDEIQALCDSATVLRGGRVTGTARPKRETAESLARMMIGSDLPECRLQSREPGQVLLQIDRLTLKTLDPFGVNLREISLTVRSGEIVGIAGVSGNGQKELLAALSGEARSGKPETIVLGEVAAGRLDPAQRRAIGLGFVPEERLGRGAVPALSLAENALLTGSHRKMVNGGMVHHGLIRRKVVRSFARDVISRFKVKSRDEQAAASSLSGGNLQKFIVGRETMLDPRIIVVAQPTWGVDVGASMLIRQSLVDLRDRGVAVLVISEELDELFMICDRLAVIAEGRLSSPVPSAGTSVEKIGAWMGGQFADAAEAAHA